MDGPVCRMRNPIGAPMQERISQMDWTTNEIDLEVYRDEIEPWLPERILDFHVHVNLPEHVGPIAPERIAANWAMEVGTEQSWEDLRATYASLFPGREVGCVAFGTVYRETLTDANNAYVLAGAADPVNRAVPLMCTRPEWPAEKLAAALIPTGPIGPISPISPISPTAPRPPSFAGIKPYPDVAPEGDESIYAFLPHGHLRVLDDAGGIVMLHLPRAGRIGDPDNIREVREIRQRYPRIKIVIAHIGRAYCLPTAQRGLPGLADDPGIFFDTSANLNGDVFRYALDTVGPDRLLFGSDLPITLLRGVREHVGEKYINYTSASYSWNTTRKSPEEEARYTFFLYEELRALISAVERSGLGKDAMTRIMHDNGAALAQIPSVPPVS